MAEGIADRRRDLARLAAMGLYSYGSAHDSPESWRAC